MVTAPGVEPAVLRERLLPVVAAVINGCTADVREGQVSAECGTGTIRERDR